jgi:hypothetical protein
VDKVVETLPVACIVEGDHVIYASIFTVMTVDKKMKMWSVCCFTRTPVKDRILVRMGLGVLGIYLELNRMKDGRRFNQNFFLDRDHFSVLIHKGIDMAGRRLPVAGIDTWVNSNERVWVGMSNNTFGHVERPYLR